jgi:protein O-GlcNAc transferase
MRPNHIRSVLVLLIVVVFFGAAMAQDTSKQAKQEGSPETAESHMGRGYDALKEERYDTAATEFRAALALDPSLVLRARFPLAVALFEMHQWDDARRELETVRRSVGDHPNVLYYLGRVDLDTGDLQKAIQELGKAASKPPFPDTTYYLGFAYLKRGDLASAEKWLKLATRQNPRDSRVYYQLAKVYRKQGHDKDAADASALSEKLRARDNNDSRVRLECAQKLDHGPLEEARAVCAQLYDGNDAEKLTSLGTIYGQHGELDDALKCFRRAAELTPQSPQVQYNLALIYYQRGEFKNALTPLENGLKRWPDLFRLNALHGAVLDKLGEKVSAYEALGRAHQLNPQDSATTDLLYRESLAIAEKDQDSRQYSDALHYLAEGAKLRPQEPEPHRRMAEIYTITSRTEQARNEEKEAEQLSKTAKN